MKRILLLVILFTGTASAAEYKAWIGGEHVTNDQDAYHLGLTIEWSHFELDLAHGVKRMKWRAIGEPDWKMGEWQSGSTTAVRWYPLNTEKFRPMVMWSHSSDATRGEPFNDKNEPTSDFLGIGFSWLISPIEFQLAAGYVGRECHVFDCYDGSSTPEIMFRVRGQIWRKK